MKRSLIEELTDLDAEALVSFKGKEKPETLKEVIQKNIKLSNALNAARYALTEGDQYNKAAVIKEINKLIGEP